MFRSPSSAFLLHSARFQNREKFSKNPFLFHKKPKIWTRSEVLLFWSHFTIICYIYQFLKKWKKSKNPSLLQKNAKVERFEKPYFFRTHSTSNLLPLAFFKDFVFYFWKIHVFFSGDANFDVLRNITISVAFYGQFATFSICKYNQLFYQKNLLFLKKPKFWKFWGSFTTSFAFYRKIDTFRAFWKNQMMIILRNLTVSGNFYYKFATFYRFLKISFFSKNPSFFKKKKRSENS